MPLKRTILSLHIAGSLLLGSACSAQPTPTGAQPSLSLADPGCTREIANVRPFLRPNHESKHARRIAELDRALQGERADVLLFGDSILFLWPEAELRRAFPGQKVLELGIKGERIAGLTYRLRAAAGGSPSDGADSPGLTRFAAQSPKRVILLIGTNDLRGKTPCYIADGTVQAVSSLKTLYPNARITVLKILPRGNPGAQFAPEIDRVFALLSATAARTRAFEVADISGKYRCVPGACDVAAAPNFLHPNDRGYALLTEGLRDAAAKR